MSRCEQKSKVMGHPCFDPSSKGKSGRIHLAVAPRCNVKCGYCTRKHDCANENRPGVTSRLLKPEEALEHTKLSLEKEPRIKVVGIAGPGDPLANDSTFETLKLVGEEFPHLVKCISTNGLALVDRITDLIEAGVTTLTVTLNGVDAEITQRIYEWVQWDGKVYRRREAAEILLERQLRGIEMAIEAGIVIKVNTVLIPGINDHHIEEIAHKLQKMGVYVMNIMPLIPQAQFKDTLPPSQGELLLTRKRIDKLMPQMFHCQQCRADAVGLIGCS